MVMPGWRFLRKRFQSPSIRAKIVAPEVVHVADAEAPVAPEEQRPIGYGVVCHRREKQSWKGGVFLLGPSIGIKIVCPYVAAPIASVHEDPIRASLARPRLARAC